MSPGTREGLARAAWRQFQRHGLAIGIALLLGLTIYYARDLPDQDWGGLGRAVAANWPLMLLAFAVNAAGVAFDYVAWRCAWRGQGVRFPAREGPSYFLSAFALQLTPLQIGRFARAAFAFRAGIAPLRAGTSAEGVLYVMDATSLVALLVAVLIPSPFWPLGVAVALLGGPVALWFAERSRALIEARFRITSQRPLLSRWNLGAYYCRMVDWLGVSTILFLVASVTGADVAWRTAAVAALGASFVAAASALPGGLGSSEAALSLGLHFYAHAALQLNTGLTVLAYRVVTFWFWLPFGWWGLLRVRKSSRRAAEARARAGEVVGPHVD